MSFHKFFRTLLISFFLVGNLVQLYSQDYYTCGGWLTLWQTDLDLQDCACSSCGCSICEVGSTNYYHRGISMSPDTNLFGEDLGIYEIDPMTGVYSLYFPFPPGTDYMQGLLAMSNNIFYTMSHFGVNDSLFEIDVTQGTITNLCATQYKIYNDLTLFNGQIYYRTYIGSNPELYAIVQLDIANSSNSSVIATLSDSYIFEGLTATDICNTLLFPDLVTNKLYLINLLDGAVTP